MVVEFHAKCEKIVNRIGNALEMAGVWGNDAVRVDLAGVRNGTMGVRNGWKVSCHAPHPVTVEGLN